MPDLKFWTVTYPKSADGSVNVIMALKPEHLRYPDFQSFKACVTGNGNFWVEQHYGPQQTLGPLVPLDAWQEMKLIDQLWSEANAPQKR